MSRPPYQSVEECPKCGTHLDHFNTKYACLRTFAGVSGEWLDRQCLLCGYEWEEACLDAS